MTTTTEEVHCHDCGMIASSPEEATTKGFCHVKVFDARRRVVVGGDDEDQKEAALGLKDDNYYWLCPGCFHHMKETLLVVGHDLSDKIGNGCRHPGMEEEEENDGV
jgi:hypothetical protein